MLSALVQPATAVSRHQRMPGLEPHCLSPYSCPPSTCLCICAMPESPMHLPHPWHFRRELLCTAGCAVVRTQCETLHLPARCLARALRIQHVLRSRAVRCRHVHVFIRAQRPLQLQRRVCVKGSV